MVRLSPAAAAGAASLGAGLIHAFAATAHREHSEHFWLLALTAAVQVIAGLAAILAAGRAASALTVAVNVAVIAGWAATRFVGIPWVEGLEHASPIGVADTIAALLALAAGVLAVVDLASGPFATRDIPALPLVVAVAAATLAGLWSGGNTHEHDEHGQVWKDGVEVDLAGVAGVTSEEETAAETLLNGTRESIRKYRDLNVALEDGYMSIGDSVTGVEHFIKWSYINDDNIVDPLFPEGLMYDIEEDGDRRLVAALYMLGTDYTLENAPDVGGELTQWHIHDNLCYDQDPREYGSTRIIGNIDENGECKEGIRLEALPMLHVWLQPQPCGPFAAASGFPASDGSVGPGEVPEGEDPACHTLHTHD